MDSQGGNGNTSSDFVSRAASRLGRRRNRSVTMANVYFSVLAGSQVVQVGHRAARERVKFEWRHLIGS